LLIRDLCKTRTAPGPFPTPLLIPSFSSRGFPVEALHADLSPYTWDCKLVSAFDLHHYDLKPKDIYSSNLLFVDSGYYERYAGDNIGEPYVDYSEGKAWTTDMYDAAVQNIDTTQSKVVRVTYDLPGPVPEQIKAAKASIDKFPSLATDFLLKGPKRNQLLDMEAVIAAVPELGFADIVGVTEKELGGSFRECCVNLARLRTAMDDANLATPLHVFGSLDPFGALAYHASGADIFDGLGWLRFAWQEARLHHLLTAGAEASAWDKPWQKVASTLLVANINEVGLLQRAAKTISKTGSLTSVPLPWSRYVEEVRKLLLDAGITEEAT